MELFGRKPPTTAPTVSTEQPEEQVSFWRKNRNSAYLFGGCILLLIVARACNSHQQQAQKVQKDQHVQQQSEREQSDKDSQISALQSQLFNAQRTVAQAKLAAETPGENPLTPAQMQQLAAAGTGTLPPSMFAGRVQPGGAGLPGGSVPVSAVVRPAGYYNPDAAVRTPQKPATLVISYRDAAATSKDESTAVQPSPAPPVAPPPGVIMPMAAPSPAPAPPSEAGSDQDPHIKAKTPNSEDQQHQMASFTGEKYRIREGTWIPCTEQLRINGFFAGNINCLVSIPIYSTSGTHLLIPQGTVALGHAAAVSGQNQQRLFVVFDELIMPDGYTVNYDNASGLDQTGQTGLRDKVDHHYLQVFGVSVGLAALSGLSQIGNYGNSAITAGSQYRSGVTQSLSESSVHILDRFSNVLPTFVIREGARNNIHLPFNLWLPDYSKHTLKGDL
jgi:type IV secretion system protein VirB10